MSGNLERIVSTRPETPEEIAAKPTEEQLAEITKQAFGLMKGLDERFKASYNSDHIDPPKLFNQTILSPLTRLPFTLGRGLEK